MEKTSWFDPYETLGLSVDASDVEIESARRRLWKECHPDQFYPDAEKVAEAEEAFKRIGEAYDLLKNPGRRAAYDGSLRRRPSLEPARLDLGCIEQGATGEEHTVILRNVGALRVSEQPRVAVDRGAGPFWSFDSSGSTDDDIPALLFIQAEVPEHLAVGVHTDELLVQLDEECTTLHLAVTVTLGPKERARLEELKRAAEAERKHKLFVAEAQRLYGSEDAIRDQIGGLRRGVQQPPDSGLYTSASLFIAFVGLCVAGGLTSNPNVDDTLKFLSWTAGIILTLTPLWLYRARCSALDSRKAKFDMLCQRLGCAYLDCRTCCGSLGCETCSTGTDRSHADMSIHA